MIEPEENEETRKECKGNMLRVEFEKGNPSVHVYCPFYADITTMKNDIKWLKALRVVGTVLEISSFISLIAIVIKIVLGV